MKFFGEYTGSSYYTIAVLAVSPFVCRERFWYYLIAVELANFVKTNLKSIESEPRPVWVWTDLSDNGCEFGFGSPSGHSTRSSNMAFLLIIDHFFASAWSRLQYADLNKMTVRKNLISFLVVSFFAVFFWLFTLYNRIYLGRHTLNQIFYGS